MKVVYGDDIASPEHEPIRFAMQVRIVDGILRREEANNKGDENV
jgi:hypothetical protein